MGILERFEDAAINKIAKKTTVRLNYMQLAEFVKEKFIIGADAEFLTKVAKTAKGGGLFTQKRLESKDGKYLFHVSSINNGLVFGINKTVWVYDKEEKKYYQTENDRQWKKFYKAVDAAVKAAMTNSLRK